MIRMTLAEYKKNNLLKRKNKYNAVPCIVDGFRFDSTAEADYYRILKYKRDVTKEVNFFLRQVPMHLPGNIKLIPDFLVFYTNHDFEMIDVKGARPTDAWTIKRKSAEAHYPLEIKIVTKKEITQLKRFYALS